MCPTKQSHLGSSDPKSNRGNASLLTVNDEKNALLTRTRKPAVSESRLYGHQPSAPEKDGEADGEEEPVSALDGKEAQRIPTASVQNVQNGQTVLGVNPLVQETQPKQKVILVTKKSSASSCGVFFMLLMFLPTIYLLLRTRRSHLISLAESIPAETEELHAVLLSAERNVHTLQRDWSVLRRKNIDLVVETEGLRESSDFKETNLSARNPGLMETNHSKTDPKLESLQAVQSRMEERLQKLEALKQELQSISKRQALRKFGNGPHFVRFDLDFSFQREGEMGQGAFVVQLAPLSLMPHSVYIFLEMIDRGLWDGCSFVINSNQLLKASPVPYGANRGANKMAAFLDAGYSGPAFQEYSGEYPHNAHTLGFMGNSDGMGFFINTRDNSDVHGPGKDGDGYTCFAKIIHGKDTVRRMQAVETVNEVWIKNHIGIQSAKIMHSVALEASKSPQ